MTRLALLLPLALATACASRRTAPTSSPRAIQSARPIELRVLASLVGDLASFNHPALQPAQYLAAAREETSGCRAWRSWPASAEIAVAPRVLPAESVAGWPAGAIAASVCENRRHFALTLRPPASRQFVLTSPWVGSTNKSEGRLPSAGGG